MKRLVILGTQWGDEGKGKITDYLAQQSDVVCRYQGGDNAGHTVIFDGKKYSLHLLPSGILNPNIDNVMANGMVINPQALIKELDKIETPFKLHISDRAHVIFPYHIALDGAYESSRKGHPIGTTQKGIGPAYQDKAARTGIRMSTFINEKLLYEALKEQIDTKNDLLKLYGKPPMDFQTIYDTYIGYAKKIKPYVKDTSRLLNDMITDHKKMLFEGAQGSLLCIEHGTYPYVTSSSPTAASVPLNTGIAPWLIDGALGVTKAYTTRVGEGILPSEIHNELANHIRIKGHEFGTTTGRPRRIGWLDTVVLKHTKRVSGLSYLAVTLLDVLSQIKPLHIVTSYELDGQIIDYIPADLDVLSRIKPVFLTLDGWDEDITQITSFDELPNGAKIYLKTIEDLVGVKIAMFSVGPDRKQTIMLKDLFK